MTSLLFIRHGLAEDYRPVPRVHPATYRYDAAFLAAHRRRERYLTWKAAGKP